MNVIKTYKMQKAKETIRKLHIVILLQYPLRKSPIGILPQFEYRHNLNTDTDTDTINSNAVPINVKLLTYYKHIRNLS